MGLKTASGDEAAAVAAAIAQFEAEFTRATAAETPAISAWQRASLLEGVNAKETNQDLEGASRWLS
jgi:hypothetical protein